MQVIKDGPDIPDEILQALEDEKLVLFCGAGISYKAGLKDFKSLVDSVYESQQLYKDELEDNQYNKQRYDLVLELLEKRCNGFVRPAVKKALTLQSDANLDTHNALIKLAETKNNACHIVTTNFDHGFLRLQNKEKISIDFAPKLPIPKPNVWKSLVHLHGIIHHDYPECENLILTSKDIGSAYIIDYWASKFIIELFRNFTVLFIGYSGDDPILRYMLDALASDRLIGINTKKAFAFAIKNKNAELEWEAKNIVPILYDNHDLLHETLEKWAELHSNGLLGKENIIREHANISPINDYRTKQVIWAIRNKNNNIFFAKIFSDVNKENIAEWLEEFMKHGLLSLAVNNIQIPIVDKGFLSCIPYPLNPITQCLGNWLAKNIRDVEVLNWIVKNGGNIHPEIKMHIRNELNNIQDSIPQDIINIWRLLSSEVYRITSNNNHNTNVNALKCHELDQRLKSALFDYTLKEEFLDLLTPQILFSPGFKNDNQLEINIPRVEVTLKAGENTKTIIDSLNSTNPNLYNQILVSTTYDLTNLLLQTMDILSLIGSVSDKDDLSQYTQPSISKHKQNHHSDSWTYLIDLLRDSWKSLLKTKADNAYILVNYWKTLKYPIFRRLVFFAMTESNLIKPKDCLNYLLEENGYWIWANEVRYEAFQLQSKIWGKLQKREKAKLLKHILSGPPNSDVGKNWNIYEKQEIGVRLKNLYEIDQSLPVKAMKKLQQLLKEFPKLTSLSEKDKFPVYMTSRVGFETSYTLEDLSQLKRNEIIEKLINEDNKLEGLMSEWQKFTQKFPSRAFTILLKLANSNQWIEDIWEAAFNGFNNTKPNFRIWVMLSKKLMDPPDDFIKNALRSAAYWLNHFTKQLPLDKENTYWPLWDRLISIALNEPKGVLKDPIRSALNHPAGILTEALMYRLVARKPLPNSNLPDDLIERFTKLTSYVISRIRLASYLYQIISIDNSWTNQKLIPYFDWDNKAETHLLWISFLLSKQISYSIFISLKPSLLKTFNNKDKLGKWKNQLCITFTQYTFEYKNEFKSDEIHKVINSLNTEELSYVALTISQLIQTAGDKSANFWREKVDPWLQKFWPKNESKRNSKSSEYLTSAAIFSKDAFPDAVDLIKKYIVKINDPIVINGIANDLIAKSLAEDYPNKSFVLLCLIVSTTIAIPIFCTRLRVALDMISENKPKLRESSHYNELDEYLKKYSQ